jgi:uncharacterized protein (TIGR02145 family)
MYISFLKQHVKAMKKTNLFRLSLVIPLGLILFLTSACHKKDNGDIVSDVTDFDGNVYRTITIGTQVWMKENLKVTHYRNGISIPQVTGSDNWSNLSTPAYCSYDNNPANMVVYGCLYNWYAVNFESDGIKVLCPEGWHVPDKNEWTTLIDYFGGQEVAGGNMKEAGTSHWLDPNSGATNQNGFSALPGGYRFATDGLFYLIEKTGCWWSSTPNDMNEAWFAQAIFNNTHAPQYYYHKRHGYSVRCIKD